MVRTEIYKNTYKLRNALNKVLRPCGASPLVIPNNSTSRTATYYVRQVVGTYLGR